MKSNFYLLLSTSSLVLSYSPVKVSTLQGLYLGNTSISGLDQFLGIPYASPPVGPLRFAQPEPYNGSSSDVKNATSYGPGCISYADTTGAGLSEDCLTVNIIRPTCNSSSNGTSYCDRDNGEPLPVLVFIYGGANINGETKWYPGDGLVSHSVVSGKPIIYISMNYRVGGLGWLYNSLFAANNILNLGLKDQWLALKWIKQNVRSFGGDPDKVTIFGQSAGAFNVWMMMRAQAVEGEKLFRGAIEMSGAGASLALRAFQPSDGDKYFASTLEAIGCANATNHLDCLRSVPIAVLSADWFNATSLQYENLGPFLQESVGFGVDGKWLTTPTYYSEPVAPVPLIVGTVLNEGSIYAYNAGPNASTSAYQRTAIATYLNTTNLPLADPVLATYTNHTPAQNGAGYDSAKANLTNAYYIGEALLGDLVQDIGRRVLLGKHSAVAPTWGYKFSQRPDLSVFKEGFYGGFDALPVAELEGLGVLHASDLAFVLGFVEGYNDATERDKGLAGLEMDMWINFAYYLDPNGLGDKTTSTSTSIPHWSRYDPLNASIFHFENQGPYTPGMQPDNLRLDSYETMRNAVEQAGNLPLLPEIRAQIE